MPCIFSLLPCGVNTLEISFQFSAPETPVFRPRFCVARCPYCDAGNIVRGARGICRAFCITLWDTTKHCIHEQNNPYAAYLPATRRDSGPCTGRRLDNQRPIERQLQRRYAGQRPHRVRERGRTFPNIRHRAQRCLRQGKPRGREPHCARPRVHQHEPAH